MHIENFFNVSQQHISFTRKQASDFAKQVANDFNPLHDINARRFCVPGDLLFAVVLSRAGLHQEMNFTFSGMVTNDIALNFPENIQSNAVITDDNNKEYLQIQTAGEQCKDQQLIKSLVQAYVGFSGQTFPHILVKLMADNNVMINPSRPMVMYENMSLSLTRLDVKEISLALSNAALTLEGKRGNACLEFDLLSEGKVIGHGKKHMLLSGLREYDEQAMTAIVDAYNGYKTTYPNFSA
jgi:hypothetical protein